ncbi:MAG: hypothetical protein IJ809_06425 [Clostridia bacterium]|nr:hypothetical protein [Clostridia bacterium]
MKIKKTALVVLAVIALVAVTCSICLAILLIETKANYETLQKDYSTFQ